MLDNKRSLSCSMQYYAYHKWLSAVLQHSDVESWLLLQMIQTCRDITSRTLSSQHENFLDALASLELGLSFLNSLTPLPFFGIAIYEISRL